MRIDFELVHKKQTKANDCWYACIQMLRTYKAGGEKTKTIGDAALNLRKIPILGRTLAAREDNSVFYQIIRDNNLCVVCNTRRFKILEIETIVDTMQALGPIMIGGMYGRLLGKKMGHFIILSGIDTERQIFLVNDPDKRKDEWRTFHSVQKDYWGTVYTDDGFNAIAIAP